MAEMTEERLNLEEIEARANAATPGPWVYVDGCALEIDDEPVARDAILGADSSVVAAFDYDLVPYEVNRDFIIHARQDIPDLVAEVRRLRAVAERCAEMAAQAAIAEFKALQALERLSSAVKRLGSTKDGRTLFEVSPTKDQDAYEAWLALNTAQQRAIELLDEATKRAGGGEVDEPEHVQR